MSDAIWTYEDAEEIFQNFEATEGVNISQDLELLDDDIVTDQLQKLNDKTKPYQQFIDQQKKENDEAMQQILQTKIGRQAYSEKWNVPIESLEENKDNTQFDMTNIINSFYNE